MLRALYELAQRQKLLENPDFEKKKIDFVLSVDDDGRAVSLVPMGDKIGRGKEIYVPRLPKRAYAIAAGFLSDKSEYVLGLAEEVTERTLRCAAEFKRLVDEAAAVVDDPGLRAVARFLAQRDTQVPGVASQNQHGPWTGGEMLVFRYAPDDTLVHERPAVRQYWGQQRSEGGIVTNRFRCLVTGESTVPARLHPSIKRIPKAQQAGASIVSFNTDAFASYGLEQGENAPVSRAAAEGYATALNWLLEPDPSSGRRFRHGIPIGEDAVLVFWTSDPHSIVDEFADLLDGPPGPGPERRAIAERTEQTAQALWTGRAPQLDEVSFYAATLSGNARVIVRDWIETTADAVQQSLKQFFADLQIGQGPARPIPLRQLLRSVAAPGRELPPNLVPRIVRAAFFAEALPRQLLLLALQRLRLPPSPDERWLLQVRVGLIRAAMNQHHRLHPLPFLNQEVPVSLDENATQVPYLLGRLFAVLEALQGAALGDINATIRDRFFGAASTTPATVFPRLLSLSNHHARKSERKDLEKLKGQIFNGLPAKSLPKFLRLEEQGLFAIGYYHQREALFRPQRAAHPTAEGVASTTNLNA